MNALSKEEKSKAASLRHFLLDAHLPLESETSWFIFLGVLDLVLTFLLLRTGVAREANPVAKTILFAGGLSGLVYFKFAMLTIAAVVAQIIARYRLRTARAIFHLGIAVQLFVVVYSVTLLARSQMSPHNTTVAEAHTRAE